MRTEKQFFKKIKSIEEDKYKDIDLDRLVLYAVNELAKNNIEATFDNVVVTVFKLFPKRFSLIGFPEYPDGKRIHDCLFHCTYKTKRWLAGNPKSGYAGTHKGEYFLEETKKILSGEIEVSKKKEKKPLRKELALINLLKESPAYKKYMGDRKNSIGENEVWNSLRCDKENSRETLLSNFNRFLNYAQKLEDNETLDFLKYLKSKYPKLLS